MRKISTPPSSPPSVSVEGLPVAPAGYEWWTSGKAVKYRAAETQEDVPLPEIAFNAGLNVAIDSPSRPTEALVTLFTGADLDSHGIPTAGSGTSVDCLSPGSGTCDLVELDDSINLDLHLNQDVQIVVVHLSYLLIDNEVKPPEGRHLIGSWGFRAKYGG